MKKKVVLIVFIIGVLLIVCGIGINMSGSKDSKKEKNETNTEDISKNEANMNMGAPDSKYYQKKSDGSMVNISEKVKGVHANGELAVDGMSIFLKSDKEPLANYSYVIKNNGTTNYSSLEVSIIFIYADGSKLNSSPSKIDLPAGASVNIDRKDFVSIIGAVDYEISYNVSN